MIRCQESDSKRVILMGEREIKIDSILYGNNYRTY